MNGAAFLQELNRKFAQTKGSPLTDRELAARLGMTTQALNNWRGRSDITPRQMAGMLAKLEARSASVAYSNAITPVVEFFELQPSESKRSANMVIFEEKEDGGSNHPYLSGLRRELETHSGIYVFHDSRGRALYAGKAVKQSLWKEINLVYNRERPVQKLRRVDHPERRQDFRTSDEIRRKILERNVSLYEIARYVSAYSLPEQLISKMEALLIRSFANDLLNARMENFVS